MIDAVVTTYNQAEQPFANLHPRAELAPANAILVWAFEVRGQRPGAYYHM